MKRDFLNILLDKGAKNKWPIMTHFDLTYKCNLKCLHCYVIREKNRKELSLDMIKKTLIGLAKMNSFLLTLSGGEVFLRKDIFHIISMTKKLNFRTAILTNGTLITSNTARFLKAHNVAEVHISIYSIVPKIHDDITRVKNSFKRAIRGIHFLIQEGVRVVISTPLMRHTFNGYKKIKFFADKLGIDYSFGPTISPCMDFNKVNTILSPTLSQLERLCSDEYVIKKDLVFTRKRAEDFVKKQYLNRPICHAGHNRCYISPYGDVSPCLLLSMKAGNLCQNTIEEIWYNSSLLNQIRDMKFVMLKKCLNCKFLAHCEPCIGMGYQGTGDLLKPYFLHCRLAKAKYRVLNKKKKGDER